ncbi:MAG: hypothetical protein ABSH46_21020 [Bryobacteraceae bacterium]|jgi:hypothetical protein
MTIARAFSVTSRVALLTILLLVYFIAASLVAGLNQQAPGSPPTPNQGAALAPLLLFCFLLACVFSYFVLRSRWAGWKLIAALFVAFYGVGFVLLQIESLVFLQTQVPRDLVPKLLLMGAILGALFAPTAAAVLGRLRGAASAAANRRLVMPTREWAWKLGAIAVAYLVLYFGFGYYVAWKNPAVRAYYHGTDPGAFALQMRSLWVTMPWLFPFQVFRALLWVACALMPIRILKGGRVETALAIGVLFAVWSIGLLLPNPYMPEVVARTHLVETFWSNLIFGAIVGGLLSRGVRQDSVS